MEERALRKHRSLPRGLRCPLRPAPLVAGTHEGPGTKDLHLLQGDSSGQLLSFLSTRPPGLHSRPSLFLGDFMVPLPHRRATHAALTAGGAGRFALRREELAHPLWPNTAERLRGPLRSKAQEGTGHGLILKMPFCWKSASSESLQPAPGSPVETLVWRPRCCERSNSDAHPLHLLPLPAPFCFPSQCH